MPPDGRNPFQDGYAGKPDTAWAAALLQSVGHPVVDGLAFPGFPDAALQDGMHGNQGAVAMQEALAFHAFVRAHVPLGPGRLLDFGCGWGRCLRPFLRDLPLADLWGFEPNAQWCALARTLNPLVTILSGPPVPDGQLPRQHFALVIAWSVFSHLSPVSAAAWLGDLACAVVPGGAFVFTTWGQRFLRRLAVESAQRDRGEPIDWYSSVCLDAAGPIAARLAAYRRDEFVWFTSGQSTLYGEAFLGRAALARLIAQDGLPWAIEAADVTTLSQDGFVLRRL